MYGSNCQQSGMPHATTVLTAAPTKESSSLRNAGQNVCACWAVSMTFLNGNPPLVLRWPAFSTTLCCTSVQLPMIKSISHFTERIQDQAYLTTSYAQRSCMRVRGRASSNYMRPERSGETGVVYTLCTWKEQSMGTVQRQ